MRRRRSSAASPASTWGRSPRGERGCSDEQSLRHGSPPARPAVGAMTALAWVAIAALGGGMAVVRFLVDSTVATRLGGGRLAGFPIGTLAVNLSGAIVLGILAGA